ncbi:HalOD1 output domain-containing protein [Halobaculum rarum]|uniref:HalOD1 output domain-containing protein n=1 Tax=Halobaculum rarum TaxID=3075122 RepID=UPI0032AF2880
MGHTPAFYYDPDDEETLSTEVVTAIAEAHDEDVLDQKWIISKDINTDALDGLFQKRKFKTTLQFEADSTTVTITANKNGHPIIKIESHR